MLLHRQRTRKAGLHLCLHLPLRTSGAGQWPPPFGLLTALESSLCVYFLNAITRTLALDKQNVPKKNEKIKIALFNGEMVPYVINGAKKTG